jgi:hypothetical protein
MADANARGAHASKLRRRDRHVARRRCICVAARTANAIRNHERRRGRR